MKNKMLRGISPADPSYFMCGDPTFWDTWLRTLPPPNPTLQGCISISSTALITGGVVAGGDAPKSCVMCWENDLQAAAQPAN